MWASRRIAATICARAFVICANGTLSKPKLSKIKGMEKFKGYSFHTGRWDYEYTGAEFDQAEGQGGRHHRDRRIGRAGDTAPRRQARRNFTYFSARHPRSISRTIGPPIQEWAKKLKPGWQAERRAKAKAAPGMFDQMRDGTRVSCPRGKNPPPGERQHRLHDAHPQAHRGDRQG